MPDVKDGLVFFDVRYTNHVRGSRTGGNTPPYDAPDATPVKVPFYWDPNIGEWLSVETFQHIWVDSENVVLDEYIRLPRGGQDSIDNAKWHFQHESYIMGWQLLWTGTPIRTELQMRIGTNDVVRRIMAIPNSSTRGIQTESGFYIFVEADEEIRMRIQNTGANPTATRKPRVMLYYKLRKPDVGTPVWHG